MNATLAENLYTRVRMGNLVRIVHGTYRRPYHNKAEAPNKLTLIYFLALKIGTHHNRTVILEQLFLPSGNPPIIFLLDYRYTI